MHPSQQHQPTQQWPPPPGWGPPPPPKKNRGVRVALALGGVLLAMIVVAVAVAPDRPSRSERTKAAASAEAKTETKAKAETGPDDPGGFACDDFAAGYNSAQTRSARVELANKVNEWAPKSKSGRIADMGVLLGRGADGSVTAWQIGADAFAQACFDAGWKN